MSLENIQDIASAVEDHTAAMTEFAGETRKRLGDIERAIDVKRAAPEKRAQGPRLITKDGQVIRCLTREDRFADLEHSLPDGIKASELDFGRMLKAMVSGNWRH